MLLGCLLWMAHIIFLKPSGGIRVLDTYSCPSMSCGIPNTSAHEDAPTMSETFLYARRHELHRVTHGIRVRWHMWQRLLINRPRSMCGPNPPPPENSQHTKIVATQVRLGVLQKKLKNGPCSFQRGTQTWSRS